VVSEEKRALRRSTLAALRALGDGARLARSAEALDRLVQGPWWARAVDILAYYPFREEVAVTPLLERAIEEGKRLWLPRIDGDRLVFHRMEALGRGLVAHGYGMQEPSPELPRFGAEGAAGPVLVLTPGVAFDREGNRLGRGRGYYDRFLRDLRRGGLVQASAVAVAFAEQLVSTVPNGPEDEKVDAVVTDREVVLASRP
jgi:5-formyltetrahydrofolate cyclo-ligase